VKEINLRDYYPHYMTDKIVEVPDEVFDILEEFRLSEAAYRLRTYRHKAFYSLDFGDDIEREALVLVLSPLEIMEQQEEIRQLHEAIASLPDKQRSRITAHYLLGLSITEIARQEHSAVSSVHEGIKRGLRRLKKFLEKTDAAPEKKTEK
jgi:RNA polymerase sigma-70 factor (ECF subfamily)